MRHSFISWLTAAAIAFGLALAGPTAANAQSVMKICASQWKEAQSAGTTGGQTWPQFLAQCRANQSAGAAPTSATSAPAPAAQSGSLFPWWQPSAPTSAPASNAGAPSAGQSVMRQCASQWKEAKAAGTTGGQTWPQFLAQCRANQRSCRRAVVGDIRSRAGAGACPNARACLSVRLAVPMVATVGSRIRLALGAAARRIHDRAPGARPLPIGHCRMGQHADGHLPLSGDPLLWAHPQGRLYVRG